MHPLKPLLPYLRSRRRQLAAGAASIALGAVFGSVAPLVVRGAVDALATEASSAVVAWYAIAVLLVAIGQGIFRFTQRRLVFAA